MALSEDTIELIAIAMYESECRSDIQYARHHSAGFEPMDPCWHHLTRDDRDQWRLAAHAMLEEYKEPHIPTLSR